VSLEADETRLMKRLGANVRRLRMQRRLTQEQLAERCDLNTRTVQKIEAGTLRILLPTTDRLRRALGVSWNRLMD
jgi:transcriptional regulator with XRE-family HTH domain